MTNQKRLLLIFFLALLGVMDAGWLSMQSLVTEARTMCGPIGGCADVLASRYSSLFGIPLAFLGLIMYITLALLAYVGTSSGGRAVDALRMLSLTGMLLSVVLMGVLGFVVQAFCFFCVLSAVIVTVIFFLARPLSAAKVLEAQTEKQATTPAWYLSAGLVIILYGAFGWSIWTATHTDDLIVARIGDEVIYESQMMRELSVFAAETERNLHEMKISWANNAIVNRLIEKEAGYRGKSVQTLADEVMAADGEVTATQSEMEAIARAWMGDQLDLTPFEWNQVRIFVIQQKREERLAHFADSLKVAYGAQVFLEPIPMVNPILDLAGSPIIGPDDAPVMIVVFTDFQCPYCASIAAILDEVRRRYPGEVAIVIKNLPLNIHPQAARAAEASLCAREQGLYHKYHDLLFTNQNKLDEQSLHLYAAQAGLDTARFSACLSEGFHRQYIERDINEANKYGVTGTPTVFVNGRPLMGNLTLDRLQQEVEASRHPSSHH